MSANILKEKSEAFGDRVIACCGVLKARQASPSLVEQFLRAGTSVGANVAEAQFAHGKKILLLSLKLL